MRVLAAFVSVLSLFSGAPKSNTTPALQAQNSASPGRGRKYSSMLPCGPNGECPPGCVCMRLFGEYGVCVVAKPDWEI